MTDPGFTHREFETLTKSVDKLTSTIEKLDERMASTYVRKDVLEPQLTQLEDRVDKHDDWWDWLVKLVVGAVILALLGLLLAQGGVP